ncbi:MAG: AMP-binding protein [Actinobacteria bacterium]|nr:AMP-binding protein [Actinomycetota bacterium]
MAADGAPATLPALVALRARELPDREAVVFPGERATFSEFDALAVEMAKRLLGAGVGRDDRVGLLMPASLDAFALQMGVMILGAVAVPVNARFKAREVSYLVRHAGMTLLVAEPAYADVLAEAKAAEACRVVLGIDDEAFVAGGGDVAAAAVETERALLQGDDDGLMLYTSGTTANPKGCVHRHSAIVAEGRFAAERLRLTEADRFWTPLPFFHCGSIAIFSAGLAAPCVSIQQPFFDPTEALDLLEHERCTVAFPAFETIWMPVLNHPRFPSADLSALRTIINAGVPNSLVQMQERMPHVPQVSCFGSTETCAFACIGDIDDTFEKRTTTSGIPLPGVEIRVIDPETGLDAAAGEPGELLMRGPTRFMRYHDDPDATGGAIDADGWFRTGDLGRRDEDGRVSFVGRLKDMLKVGGENVAAAEVESYLLTHPATDIVQVVGVPDARYIEVPAAYVQLAPGTTATEQELIDFCRGQIATYKVPRYVRFVDEWPMSGTKIQKFKLRERLCAELDAAGISEAPRITSR